MNQPKTEEPDAVDDLVVDIKHMIADINARADAAISNIRMVDSLLEGLGMEVWGVLVSHYSVWWNDKKLRPDDYPDMGELGQATLRLGYSNLDNSWGLSIRETIKCKAVIVSDKVYRLARAPRAWRIAAADRLPDLMRLIHEQLKESLQRATSKATEEEEA